MNDHELENPVIGILLFLVRRQTLTLYLFNHQNMAVTQTGDTSTNYFVCTTLVYLLVEVQEYHFMKNILTLLIIHAKIMFRLWTALESEKNYVEDTMI